MKKLLISFTCLILIACAAPIPKTYSLTTTFDIQATQALLIEGNNTLKGNAFMRQLGGGVVTCAGQYVQLVPATAYANERIQALYNNTQKGVNYNRNFIFNPDYPEYKTLQKTTQCDAQGHFVFEKLTEGEFFVVTSVTWQVASNLQGGILMHRVKLSGGSTLSIIMAP